MSGYLENIQIVRNDFGQRIEFEITDQNHSPVNLSTVVQITFHAWKVGEEELECSGVCSVITSNAGTCYYIIAEGDFIRSGDFLAEIERSYATQVITDIGLNILVWPDLPGGY